MIVKIKKLNEKAIIPFYAKDGDAGMDLTAISASTEDCYTEYGTGLSIEIPYGHVGLIFPRSSISKTANILSNSVGVIDSGYRGEIKLRFKVSSDLLHGAIEQDKNPQELLYKPGDKIGQLIILPYPQIEFEEVDELSFTERGEGGFGSTNETQLELFKN